MKPSQLLSFCRDVFGILIFYLPIFLIFLPFAFFEARGLLIVVLPGVVATGLGLVYWLYRRKRPEPTRLVEELAEHLNACSELEPEHQLGALANHFSVPLEELKEALESLLDLLMIPLVWDKKSGKIILSGNKETREACPFCRLKFPKEVISGTCKSCRAVYVQTCHRKPFFYL